MTANINCRHGLAARPHCTPWRRSRTTSPLARRARPTDLGASTIIGGPEAATALTLPTLDTHSDPAAGRHDAAPPACAPADGSALVQAAWQALSSAGPLARTDASYLERDGQLRMAAAVAQAIEQRAALVVEAGTGVGKTFAYLVPVLLSGRRALVSTATKNLQDQLFWRDLPRLKQVLGVPATTALLKGRASYLCPYRLDRARGEATFTDRSAIRALARIERWAASTATGDLGELEGLDERSEVIPLVTSTRENCLGSECPRFSACPLMRARREALAADVVVVNHHLFFADLALREGGVAELLPTVDVAVFDEAHQMVDIGVQFLGQTLATGQAIDLARDIVGAGLQQARGLAPWTDLASRLEILARELRLAAAGPRAPAPGAPGDGGSSSGRSGGNGSGSNGSGSGSGSGSSSGGSGGSQRRSWERAQADASLSQALEALGTHAASLVDSLEPLQEIGPDFVRLRQRCESLRAQCVRFQGPPATGQVRWVDLTTHQARLVESPTSTSRCAPSAKPYRGPGSSRPRRWATTSGSPGSPNPPASATPSGCAWRAPSTTKRMRASTCRCDSPRPAMRITPKAWAAPPRTAPRPCAGVRSC
jgi:ATP-dependent DNA helicase DinG